MGRCALSGLVFVLVVLLLCSGGVQAIASPFGSKAIDLSEERRWVTGSVDTLDDVGGFASLAIDVNDKAHICYYDYTNSDLKYATNAGGDWDIQVIDPEGFVGQYASLALDSSNHVHVSYCDLANGDLRYATNMGGAWYSLTIDAVGDVGHHTSIAVDLRDHVHISYYDNTAGDLRYATNALGFWSFQTLASLGTVGAWSSIAVDSRHRAHISCYNADEASLMYFTNASGHWTSEEVAVGGGTYSSIALDPAERVHISYREGEVGECGDLWYATNKDGRWERVLVERCTNGGAGLTPGGYSSIALDGSNRTHISYYDPINGDLMYATDRTGSWSRLTIDGQGNVGAHASLALDSLGLAHIAYYDGTNGDLRYASEASVPTAPRALGIAAGDSALDLNWTAPHYTGPGTVTYHLYRNGTAIWSGTETSHRDENLTRGTEYGYTVTAENQVGEGPESLKVTGIPFGAPSVPMNLTGVTGLAYANISWSRPLYAGPGSLSYHLFREGGLLWSGTATTYNDTSVNVESTYRYDVVAENEVGWGENVSIQVTVPAGELIAPAPPSDLQVQNGDADLTLTWSPPKDTGTSPITMYYVYRGTSTDDLTLLCNVTEPKFIDTDLTNGKEYYYKVSAVSNAGESALTNVVSGKPSSSGTLDQGTVAIASAIIAVTGLGLGLFIRQRR